MCVSVLGARRGRVYEELSILEQKGFVQVGTGPDGQRWHCVEHRQLSSGSVTPWGWGGRGDARGKGGTCERAADALCCTAETTTLGSRYTPKPTETSLL